MNEPLDILIPYWGDPAYAIETIDSIQAQTSDNYRVTVIDDAYPGTIIRDYLHDLQDNRYRYFRKEQNEGIIENFRSCVRAARSPLMTMPGADDRLLPGYVAEIERLSRELPDAAVYQPGVRVIDEEGFPSRTLPDMVKDRIVRPNGNGDRLLAGERLAVSLLHGDWLYWPSLTFRTARIQQVPFRDGFPIILDLALILDMVFSGDSLALSDEVVFEYRRHRQSLSSTQLLSGTRFADEREYFRIAAGQAADAGWPRARRAARAHLTSRAYAGLTFFQALRTLRFSAAPSLLGHIVRF